MNQIMLLAAENTLVALCLALLVYGLTRFWRHPPLEHLAWLLVLIKLVAPPLFAVDRSALLPAEVPQPAAWSAVDTGPVEPGFVGPGRFDASRILAEPFPAAADGAPGSTVDLAPALLVADDDPPSAAVSLTSAWASLGPIVFGLWLAGVAVWALLTAVHAIRFGRMLGETLPAPQRVQRLSAEIAAKLQVRSVPTVRYVDSVGVPLVWWAGRRPSIALPIALVGQWDEEQLALVLAHELAHLRRRDHWVRVVEIVVSCLYWWNPLIWLIRRQLHRAEDVCCDAWVGWAFPDRASHYAELVLRVAESLSPAQAKATLLPASQFLRSHSLKARIEMILQGRFAPQVSKKLLAVAALASLVVLPSLTVGDRVNAQAEEDSPAASDATPATAAPTTTPVPAPAAAAPVPPPPTPSPGLDTSALAKKFKYQIPVELGRAQNREGGKIEIREIWGTRPKIEIGGQYVVRGKYVLPPGQRGKLYFYLTSKGPSGKFHSLDLQSSELDGQEGFFTLVHGMSEPGYFHLILTDAKSYTNWFADVYFGSGDNIYRDSGKDNRIGVRGDGADFPHVVRFQPEESHFLDGDRITITEVRGTSDTFSPGNTYEINGTYKLASRDKATLIADLATTEQRRRGPPWPTVEAIQVERGEGPFTLRLAMNDPGRPRLAFSPIGGTEKSIGYVYLRSGDESQRDGKQPATDAAKFPKTVPFELREAKLAEGDQIKITEVRGTDEQLTPGGSYSIKGTYKLTSHAKAMLAAYVTATEPGEGRNAPTVPTQQVSIERGAGTFDLVLPMLYRGRPHVSFYAPDSGQGFGGVYFGSGDADGAPTSKTPTADPAGATQSVKFELGTVNLADGDKVTITEVLGTSEQFVVGGTYRVKGTYKLASRDKATLAAYVTATERGQGRGVNTLPTQHLSIERGEGKFELVLPMPYRGWPHVSFYATDSGQGFGGAYFGTGDSVKPR